ENPHQKAAFYRQTVPLVKGKGLTDAKQLHGKQLSFNNIVDLDSAWQTAVYFSDPTVVIVKHNNPCGVGQDKDLSKAYKKALAGDPVSAFGSIVAVNQEVDEAMAKEMSTLFVECIIAPNYSSAALKVLKQKKNLRIIEMGKGSQDNPFKGFDFKRISGGLLIQDQDDAQLGINDIKIVTKKEPSVGQLEDLFFAWGVAKHVKSNTIVLAKNNQVTGVGAGQMSRIDAAELAVKKSGKEVKGTVLASDAFFPFKDVVELAAKHGISAIIQPGGSKRDQESIDAANQNGIAMVFTGRRHFRH
ncbi:MAG: bifunctional phosphoribosylaminoimidazolecarboxamide formyltransferase/IMP cyclohydrolase, partial [bacterium]